MDVKLQSSKNKESVTRGRTEAIVIMSWTFDDVMMHVLGKALWEPASSRPTKDVHVLSVA